MVMPFDDLTPSGREDARFSHSSSPAAERKIAGRRALSAGHDGWVCCARTGAGAPGGQRRQRRSTAARRHAHLALYAGTCALAAVESGGRRLTGVARGSCGRCRPQRGQCAAGPGV